MIQIINISREEQMIKDTLEELLENADVKLDGKRKWDVSVNNDKLYARLISGGSLALGESYMDGWWDCQAIDEMIYRLLKANLDKKVKSKKAVWNYLKAKFINQQRQSKAYEIGQRHYDIGNNLYKMMLDKGMNYSCGYWKNAENLDQAQEDKLDLICRKLKLKPGLEILDIGCGWGGFANYAAENYGVNVIGITVSKEQVKLAKELCDKDKIEIKLQDYRKVDEKFDRIVSIGMIEHVGYKNYRKFMKVSNKCLKENGIFLLHTIGGNTSIKSGEPWTSKYIFPNSMLPSAKQLATAWEGIFQLEDWHNFGKYYDPTLMAWHKNFNDNWKKIKDNYDERFRRMWNYYLLSSAGSFRARKNQLWQIVLTKIESEMKYKRITE